MNSKLTISNILIAIAAMFTIAATFDTSYYQYGMNSKFLNQGEYHIYILQFFTSKFLHGDVLHLIMNSIFIIIFGSVVEQILGEKKYIGFFVFSAIFTGLALSYFNTPNTYGMSGFVMAILAFYTLQLYNLGNPEYKGGITALVVSIGIGFFPGISLIGHLFGAIAGIIYYYLLRILK